ncbi:multidrug resistance efflux pump [Pedobacter cryoconitis]|uniref:Multidrug resistance efflux pump n=1 Tax=Pedobacter cryoconitis TaxID=188932 RepID=A0A7W8ZJS3_9SPHI|nr:HlyD family efflux transporter periplasmic adaptor subunit [Pedobacter cryoconitis]MBB5635306.1 multidrug resistance efflux pump [Pedobacter cryoconitis]
MEITNLNNALHSERTEEVQHIIERMPTRFGFWITMIVAFLFALMAIFGWLIRYPDVVTGQIVINANAAPVKLIANASGKLKLLHIKSMGDVKEGEVIGYVENSSNLRNVIYLDSLIKKYNPNSNGILELSQKLPNKFSLGELNVKYFSFTSALQLFKNYKQDHLFEQQQQNLQEILKEQQKAILAAEKRIEMSMKMLIFAGKFYSRDSLLFVKKVISETELDKSQLAHINAKDNYQSALNNLINSKQQLQQTQSKSQELDITKPEKEKELQIALISTYNDLVDNIKSWEQKYIFKAPFGGKVQFLKFYTENQFVQSGEEIFTVIPQQGLALGQVILPAIGAGKIKSGQEVIVKLDNYPYREYGSVTGTVNSISLTTSTTKTEKNNIDTYQILVDFPNQLKTNYGSILAFKAESKGSAEIITSDRRLIQRLFDNLKYVIKK